MPQSSPESEASTDAPAPAIGTLNEGPLHEALKDWYAQRLPDPEAARFEVPVGGYVADLCDGDGVLYEIQTGGFAPLKRKLRRLVRENQVVLVYPIAVTLTLVKLADGPNGRATRRRSPKRGKLFDVVDELVSIPTLLREPNFELEVVLVHVDEVRTYDPKRVRRRRGWRVVRRDLTEVVGFHRFSTPDDVAALLPASLPSEFTTADLATALGRSRHQAQKLAYVLRESGCATVCGKKGNALVYRLDQ